ncbi:hypothetical protein TIFTF001_028476 [Ficus carica]|uniref:Uncharacterized protein n=1 Tax=Ficus carica TaxID=3494 RepID=A0AA88DQ19_FICCA|nr:hypothetical protein TIFTF001_028476 [Ficus carica]
MFVEKRGKGKTDFEAIKDEGLCLGSRETKVEDNNNNNNNNKDHLGLEEDKRDKVIGTRVHKNQEIEQMVHINRTKHRRLLLLIRGLSVLSVESFTLESVDKEFALHAVSQGIILEIVLQLQVISRGGFQLRFLRSHKQRQLHIHQ